MAAKQTRKKGKSSAAAARRAKKKQNVNSIVADFARFKSDYDKLIQHTPDSEAYSAQELQKIWDKFIKR